MTNDKKHDSIMNGLDGSLEYSLDMTWLELYATKEYNEISEAVWRLCHGEQTLKDEDE